MKKAILLFIFQLCSLAMFAQINTDRVDYRAQRLLYFEDYVLSITIFQSGYQIKTLVGRTIFLPCCSKINLDDYKGAEEDCTLFLNGTFSWYRHITHVVLPVRVRRNLTEAAKTTRERFGV